VADGTTEDNQIEERVGTKTVGTMNRDTSSLTASEQTWNNLVLAVLINSEHLTSVLGGDTAHVVVNGGKDRDGLLGNVDTGEDRGGLGDTWETLVENLWWQVRKLEVDVVLVWANTTSITNLHSHASADNITRCKILGGRCVSLHESLTLAVEEVATLTTRTLGDQASSSVDTGRVELDEFEILVGETGTGDHGHSISGTGVCGCAGEVGATVSTGGKNGVVGAEAVESTIFLVVGNDTLALTILHDEVNGEELDEVVCVVSEGLSVKSVEQCVAGSVGGGTAAVCLTSLAKFLGLSTESTLVDLAVVGSGEWTSVVLQLVDGSRRLTGHVVDGVLVTQPVGTLDGIVHVPSPVVVVHVSERGVDATLGGDGVGSCGKQLGDTGRVEARLGQSKGCSQTSSSCTDDEGIVFVVNDGVFAGDGAGCVGCSQRLAVGDDLVGAGRRGEGAR